MVAFRSAKVRDMDTLFRGAKGNQLRAKGKQLEPKGKSSMKHLIPFLIPILAILCGQSGASESNSAPPNLLLIIADDCTYRDLEAYGGQAKSPHLEKLTSEGMKFTHCFQAAPMCSPTRHCLYTGLYPVKSGAYPNHTMAHGWVKSITHYLQDAGYTTHLSGKTHINPRSVFPFQYSGNNSPDPQAFAAVLESSSATNKPFLFIAASNEPHTPWNRVNLASDPQFAEPLAALRRELDGWMKTQGDEGQATELKALERMPRNAAKEDKAPKKNGKKKEGKQ